MFLCVLDNFYVSLLCLCLFFSHCHAVWLLWAYSPIYLNYSINMNHFSMIKRRKKINNTTNLFNQKRYLLSTCECWHPIRLHAHILMNVSFQRQCCVFFFSCKLKKNVAINQDNSRGKKSEHVVKLIQSINMSKSHGKARLVLNWLNPRANWTMCTCNCIDYAHFSYAALRQSPFYYLSPVQFFIQPLVFPLNKLITEHFFLFLLC